MARTYLSRGGEYVPPDANFVARGLFIEFVARLVPDALDELNALAPQLPDTNIGASMFDAETFDRERPLREWCLTYGFTAVPWVKLDRDETGGSDRAPMSSDWLLELARQTTRWLRGGGDPQQPSDVIKLCVTASYAAVEDPEPPRWNIDLETQRAFIARQKAYRVQVIQAATAAGRVAARRYNRSHLAERGFEWLALFQVGRLEVFQIRDRCTSRRPSVDTIRSAIKEAATQAGVHLRPARRGRPRE